MRVVTNVARNLRHVYAEQGVRGVLAASKYYLARTQAAVSGPGRICPICGWSGRDFVPLFLLADRYVRRGAVCPQCRSHERQRAFVPAMVEILATELGDRQVDVVEISPDDVVTPVLLPHARTYRASNYRNSAPGQLQLDLHDIALPNESNDLFVMSYVLCCIRDDIRAAREMWRVLRPGGLVIACEAFAPGEAHDEWAAEGHGGTWRRYGRRDVADRFDRFDVRLLDVTSSLGAAERRRRGVMPHEYVLVMRKRAAAIASVT